MGMQFSITRSAKKPDGTFDIETKLESWPNPLPCPFCGSREVLYQTTYQPYLVMCRDCGARIESGAEKRMCLEKWNRRANDG